MFKKYESFVKKDKRIYEMVYDKKTNKTSFVSLDELGKIVYDDFVELENQDPVYPYPTNYDLISNNGVLFPNRAIEYGTEEKLLQEIRDYMNKYLQISDFFQEVVPYYVMFTWIYDNFEELPYLRVLAGYGQGKSRFLKIIGSVCYKPTFTFGATTTSPTFRTIDQYKGTFIIDEADMNSSDAKNEMVQILNSGYQKDMPIYRAGDSKEQYNPTAYQVFGPKIIASRFPFLDIALESRCLIEKMSELTRKDIPLNLGDEYRNESLKLRNKLVLWRLKNYGKRKGNKNIYDYTVSARLNQIIFPLSSVIKDEKIINKLRNYMKLYNQELINDQGMTKEANVFICLVNILNNNKKEDITIKMIADKYNIEFGNVERKITPRKIGSIVSKSFNIKTVRKNYGFVIDKESFERKKESLCKKYGFNSEEVNNVNVVEGDFKKELNNMDIIPTF